MSQEKKKRTIIGWRAFLFNNLWNLEIELQEHCLINVNFYICSSPCSSLVVMLLSVLLPSWSLLLPSLLLLLFKPALPMKKLSSRNSSPTQKPKRRRTKFFCLQKIHSIYINKISTHTYRKTQPLFYDVCMRLFKIWL